MALFFNSAILVQTSWSLETTVFTARQLFSLGSPAICVVFTRIGSIGSRRNFNANFTLLMRLDRALARVFCFTPFQSQDVTYFNICINYSQRQQAAFVIGITIEHGHTNGFAVFQQLISITGRVVVIGEVD